MFEHLTKLLYTI